MKCKTNIDILCQDLRCEENKCIKRCVIAPDTEIFIVRSGVKSTVTDNQGQDLRPVYDQIREHVHICRASIEKALYILMSRGTNAIQYSTYLL